MALGAYLKSGAVLALLGMCLQAGDSEAAAACVVAKKMGNSLEIEWIAQNGPVIEQLVAEAKSRLKAKGFGQDRYEDLFPQANTPLDHAHVIIVHTKYLNARGKQRSSYGCGYSAKSYTEAEWAALRDLQSYSWGWTPDKGYEVIEKYRY